MKDLAINSSFFYEIISTYSIKIINSLFLTLLFLGGYLLSRFFLMRRVKARKIRHRYSTRLKYLFFIFFMVFFIKIWVEGFTQILTFVGFFGAALVLTQRDNLMNLVGWLIINWRGLFSEDDYIKISNYSGYVDSIGFLYFSLLEASPEFPDTIKGRIIRVPNGWVSKNPVINFSHDKLIEHTMSFVFKPRVRFELIDELFGVLRSEMLGYLEQQLSLFSERGRKDSGITRFLPKYLINLRQEKPAGYEMKFLFYCKQVDKVSLQFKVTQLIESFTQSHPELVMAFD